MDTPQKERRDFVDGLAFRIMVTHTPMWLIVSVSGRTEADVLRCIKLAESAPEPKTKAKK